MPYGRIEGIPGQSIRVRALVDKGKNVADCSFATLTESDSCADTLWRADSGLQL